MSMDVDKNLRDIGILKAKAEQKKQGQIFAGKLNQIILNL